METILLLTNNQVVADSFIRSAPPLNSKIIVVNDQESLFAYINANTIDAFILDNEFSYTQIASNTIKGIKKNIPLVILHNNIIAQNFILGVDVNYMIFPQNLDLSSYGVLHFIKFQLDLYAKLNSYIPKETNEIYFGDGFKYDVLYRTLYLNGIILKRFSTKEGKLFEILIKNYRSVVKRDFILEEVWHKTDIYSSRSSDVYITKLRNFFKEYDLKLSIKNISGIGLVLE